MELYSDNLFAFVLRRFRQKENKNKQEENKRFQMSIKTNSPQMGNKNYKNPELINYFHALIINNSNISSVLYNSIDPFINECFNNLEYLSITNNYIRNLDFILKLPNLFFLDLFGNPIEELAALNNKNIFGYLRLSIEFFNEKKILNIFNLICGILDIDLKDKNIIKLFSINNHHICLVNNEINYMIDKIKNEENKLKNYKRRKKQRKSDISQISFNSNSLDISNSDIKRDLGINHLIKNLSTDKEKNDYIAEKPIENIIPKNPSLLEIKNFFTNYQTVINRNLNYDYKLDKRSRKNLILNNNENFTSQNMETNKKYLKLEKEKLILLFEIYKKITVFNKDKNDNKYYIGNIYNINVNNHIDNIFVKEIKDNIMNHSQIPRTSIIILISIIFYAIGTISDKMMNALINYILAKYYDYDENQKFPDFSNLGNIHYLAFYYSTYNYIYNRMIDNEKNINIDKYRDILNILQMEKLILKSNYLNKKVRENKSRDDKIELREYKKIKINSEIHSIKELNITKEFLILIEFLCDYIIYEKIEELLINNSYLGEYSYLIELKETLEETEFQMNNNNFMTNLSLSALKFQKNKKERIFNKFYFEKDKIKQIKNKDFKNYVFNDFNKSRTLNNFSTAIGNSVLFNSTNSNFNNMNFVRENEDDEYNKYDDIDVDEFFYIDSKRRNSNNKLKTKKNNSNISIYKSKDKDNDYFNNNSLVEENNTSFRLPNVYQNQPQPYEEFEFLKKMIFDPDFLSHHARNVIKFEKQKKKLNKKYPNLSIKNVKTISKNDGFKTKKEESKLFENTGNACFTHFESSSTKYNKNLTKTNLNLDSTSNEISLNTNKYKMILNSNNKTQLINKYKTPINFKSNNIINLNRIIDNEKERKTIEINNNKKCQIFERKCNITKHKYKGPFSDIPESFPGITLLNFGLKKSKTQIKKLKISNRKSPPKIDEEKKKTYKEQVMNKIRKTIKDNILRNARIFAYPMYQYS